MAKETHYYTKFESGRFYHVYNRTIDKKKMFVNHGNYLYFLKKFSTYLDDLIEVYAYCLLDNHFHFLIRIKENENLDLHNIVSKQFRLLFQSYALAFNKTAKSNWHFVSNTIQKGFGGRTIPPFSLDILYP
ncbi:hypothetical protein D3C87_266180 [compost metagenome]